MKLNLGAGNLPLEGYINHDLKPHRPEIKIWNDLNEKKWSFLSGKEENFSVYDQKDSIDEIRAWDLLEHLDSCINFMDNCWNLLKSGGILNLKVCGWKNPNFHKDPTHKKAYDIDSFDYFDPDTQLGQEYSYYTDRKWKILEKILDRKGNVIAKLTPRK